jgi:aarF domain-containing kinase
LQNPRLLSKSIKHTLPHPPHPAPTQQEDLGVPWHELYASFSPTPIAAASLAQVHRAVTHDGDAVAVKIQYPRLASQVQTDFTTLKVLATVVGTLFKNWEYTWLFPELEESVHLELDFLQEATNGERVGRLFERDRRIHIPRVRWDLSSSRVLTMEFIDGVKVTDVQTLRGEGIDPRAVGETISNLFSLMVFSLGLTHCDPHPGMFMRGDRFFFLLVNY